MKCTYYNDSHGNGKAATPLALLKQIPAIPPPKALSAKQIQSSLPPPPAAPPPQEEAAMTRTRLGSMRSMYQRSKSVRLHALASMHGGSMSATMHLLAGSDLRILDDIDAMGDLGIGDQVCVLRSNHALHHSHNTYFAWLLRNKHNPRPLLLESEL